MRTYVLALILYVRAAMEPPQDGGKTLRQFTAIVREGLTTEEVHAAIASRRKDPSPFEVVGARAVKFSNNLDVAIKFASGGIVTVNTDLDHIRANREG